MWNTIQGAGNNKKKVPTHTYEVMIQCNVPSTEITFLFEFSFIFLEHFMLFFIPKIALKFEFFFAKIFISF